MKRKKRKGLLAHCIEITLILAVFALIFLFYLQYGFEAFINGLTIASCAVLAFGLTGDSHG